MLSCIIGTYRQLDKNSRHEQLVAVAYQGSKTKTLGSSTKNPGKKRTNLG
jgi:hypothetical protein